MVLEKFDPDDPEQGERFRSFFGPHHVDQLIRQSIQVCWMALPADKKGIEEVEKQIRRIVDRALRDLREDSDAFGLGGGDGWKRTLNFFLARRWMAFPGRIFAGRACGRLGIDHPTCVWSA